MKGTLLEKRGGYTENNQTLIKKKRGEEKTFQPFWLRRGRPHKHAPCIGCIFEHLGQTQHPCKARDLANLRVLLCLQLCHCDLRFTVCLPCEFRGRCSTLGVFHVSCFHSKHENFQVSSLCLQHSLLFTASHTKCAHARPIRNTLTLKQKELTSGKVFQPLTKQAPSKMHLVPGSIFERLEKMSSSRVASKSGVTGKRGVTTQCGVKDCGIKIWRRGHSGVTKQCGIKQCGVRVDGNAHSKCVFSVR